MKSKMIVAIVQMKSSTDKNENLESSVRFIEEAGGKNADYIFFPEFQMAFSPSNQNLDELYSIAESISHSNFLKKLRQQSKRYNIGIVGTMFEKNKTTKDKRVFDTAFVIDKNAKLISIYRKLHLYDAFGFKESTKFINGDKITKPCKTIIGKMGVMICYDLRFPELARILALEGSYIMAIPSGWVNGVMKEEHWITMLKARAIENGNYIIAANQVGNIFCGRSMVVDPLGSVLTDLGDKIGLEVVEIDKQRINQVRNILPLLRNRREDVYKISQSD